MSDAPMTISPTLPTTLPMPTQDVGVTFSYEPGIGWILAWVLTGLLISVHTMLTYIVWDMTSGVSGDPLVRQVWLLVVGSWLVAAILLGFVWVNFVLRQRGELVVYADRLEFSRRGPFAQHITLATHKIKAVRLEFAKYPLNLPLTIQGVADKIHLPLQRVRIDDQVVAMPKQAKLCQHPLLEYLIAVSGMIPEGRQHLLAKWKRLEHYHSN